MKLKHLSPLALLLFATISVNAQNFGEFDRDISVMMIADPLRPNTIVSGQVRIFTKKPYEASSILLSLSCVESAGKSWNPLPKYNPDDFRIGDQNAFSLPSNGSFSNILDDDEIFWLNNMRRMKRETDSLEIISENRTLFEVAVFLEVNRTEPLLKESLFPFHLVVPNVNFPPNLGFYYGHGNLGASNFDVVYGYKVTLFNETGKRSFNAAQTPFYPVVSFPQPDSMNPLKVAHTFEPIYPSFGWQEVKEEVSEVGFDMVATIAAGDTYVAGETIVMSVILTPNITTKPAPKFLSFSASVHQHKRVPSDWSSSTIESLDGFFGDRSLISGCNTISNITLDEPFTLAIPLNKAKYPDFDLTYIQLNHYLELTLITRESIWTKGSASARMKIPIRIVSQKYSGIEDPLHYTKRSTEPYFVSAEEAASTTPEERNQAAPARKPDVVHQGNQIRSEFYQPFAGSYGPPDWLENDCFFY